jgi:hypothetical protein
MKLSGAEVFCLEVIRHCGDGSKCFLKFVKR